MEYFYDTKNPTMGELVNWFQCEFTDLADEMKESNHAAEANEPNPYHLEDSVWTHTMMVCMQAEMDNAHKINLISALLHDTGKPASREVIPFNKPKPVHSESNEIREADTENSKTKELGRKIKTHFRGHEGLSVYKSMAPLNALVEMRVIFPTQMEDILKIISLHGTLFDSIKDGKEHKPEKVAERWKNDKDLFEYFVNQVRYDSAGRFASSKGGEDPRTATSNALGKTIYGKDFMKKYWSDWANGLDEGTKMIASKSVTCLVGVPLSGKSTFISDLGEDDVVISRDATLLELGQFKYGKGLTYSDVWKKLSDDDQTEIDKMIRNQFEIAVRRGNNIFIDMTNVSPKARRKWLSFQATGSKEANAKFREAYKSYGNRAIFFKTDYDTIFTRNVIRNKMEGKFIPEPVIHNMMKGFIMPMGNEVELVQFR